MITLTKLLKEKNTNQIFNTLTKYPSIMTYHKISNGIFNGELSYPNTNKNIPLFVTEKIDGTNTRIVILNNDFVIGTREDWIYAKGDRIIPSAQAAYLENLIKCVEELMNSYPFMQDTIYCIYGEMYGSRIQKSWKSYTLSNNTFDYRIFDIWSMHIQELSTLLTSFSDIAQASSWREHNKQPWFAISEIEKIINYSMHIGILSVPLRDCIKLSDIPEDIQETYNFLLNQYKTTLINLDGEDKQNANAEGIVVRTPDRSFIAKLRFEDYEKTLRKLKTSIKVKNV